MKKYESKSLDKIKEHLLYFNNLHDGVIKKISLYKKRGVDPKSGDLIYLFEAHETYASCDIEIELLLNSYDGAKMDQAVVICCKDARSLMISQKEDTDFSDVFECAVTQDTNLFFTIIFFISDNKHPLVQINCAEIIFIE